MGAALPQDLLPHYTYDDYVKWEGRWEIIYGVPYAMSPQPNLYHQKISKNITVLLESSLKDQAEYTSFLPVDWEIADDIIVQPDNLVVKGNPTGVKLTDTPVIVFEILSPSTSKKDKKLKYKLYEQAKVQYFIIVDPDTRLADVFVLTNGTYQLKLQTQTEPFTFELENFELIFNFAEIWN